MSTALGNAFTATIAASGTLSTAIDTEGWTLLGLLIKATASTLTLSTLTPLVSADGVTFATLQEPTAGVLGNVAWTHGTGNFALSGAPIAMIAPYRYVKFIESAAQVNGATIQLAVKQI